MADMYEYEFTWPEQASAVIVTGTFDNWTRSVQLAPSITGFSAKVKIPYGEKTDFKFIVDNGWRIHAGHPTEYDNVGNMNNYIMAPAAPSPSVTIPIPTPEEKPTISGVGLVTPIKTVSYPTPAVTPTADVPQHDLNVDPAVARDAVQPNGETVATPTNKLDEPAKASEDKTEEATGHVQDTASTPVAERIQNAALDIVTITMPAPVDLYTPIEIPKPLPCLLGLPPANGIDDTVGVPVAPEPGQVIAAAAAASDPVAVPAPAQDVPKSPSTPPPSSSKPVAETPKSVHEKASTTTSTTVTTPTKSTFGKRNSGSSHKRFPSFGGSPKGKGSDDESPPSAYDGSVRKKKHSLICKIKRVFSHDHGHNHTHEQSSVQSSPQKPEKESKA